MHIRAAAADPPRDGLRGAAAGLPDVLGWAVRTDGEIYGGMRSLPCARTPARSPPPARGPAARRRRSRRTCGTGRYCISSTSIDLADGWTAAGPGGVVVYDGGFRCKQVFLRPTTDYATFCFVAPGRTADWAALPRLCEEDIGFHCTALARSTYAQHGKSIYFSGLPGQAGQAWVPHRPVEHGSSGLRSQDVAA